MPLRLKIIAEFGDSQLLTLATTHGEKPAKFSLLHFFVRRILSMERVNGIEP
jgi:hypothetical protein